MDKDLIDAFIKPLTPVFKNSFFGYALSQAILDDYSETISKITGEETETIKKRILQNANFKFDTLRKETDSDIKEQENPQ